MRLKAWVLFAGLTRVLARDLQVGTVPRATPELVAEAFRIAHAYKPKLTRYQRQKILLRTAELLVARKEELSRLITLESGLCLKDSLYEVGRAYDVFTFAGQLCLMDDGQTFSCDLTPHGKPRRGGLRRRNRLRDHSLGSWHRCHGSIFSRTRGGGRRRRSRCRSRPS